VTPKSSEAASTGFTFPKPPPNRTFSTHDEYSADDIHRWLDSINDRIEELATDGSYDWIHLSKHKTSWTLQEAWKDDQEQSLMDVMGRPFFKALKAATVNDPDASVLLRMAYQAIIVNSICPAGEPFMAVVPQSYDDGADEVADFLEEGDRMRNSMEGRKMYGLWRTSKHRELRNSLNAQDEADNIHGYSRTACIWCFHCTSLFMGEHRLVYDSFLKVVYPKLEDITRDILKLSSMMHEGVITKEYSLYRLSYPEEVNRLKMEIEEDDLDSTSTAPDRVLCTLRFGLQCSDLLNDSSTSLPVVVKKARVLTENVLQIMLPTI